MFAIAQRQRVGSMPTPKSKPQFYQAAVPPTQRRPHAVQMFNLREKKLTNSAREWGRWLKKQLTRIPLPYLLKEFKARWQMNAFILFCSTRIMFQAWVEATTLRIRHTHSKSYTGMINGSRESLAQKCCSFWLSFRQLQCVPFVWPTCGPWRSRTREEKDVKAMKSRKPKQLGYSKRVQSCGNWAYSSQCLQLLQSPLMLITAFIVIVNCNWFAAAELKSLLSLSSASCHLNVLKPHLKPRQLINK